MAGQHHLKAQLWRSQLRRRLQHLTSLPPMPRSQGLPRHSQQALRPLSNSLRQPSLRQVPRLLPCSRKSQVRPASQRPQRQCKTLLATSAALRQPERRLQPGLQVPTLSQGRSSSVQRQIVASGMQRWQSQRMLSALQIPLHLSLAAVGQQHNVSHLPRSSRVALPRHRRQQGMGSMRRITSASAARRQRPPALQENRAQHPWVTQTSRRRRSL